MSRILFDMVGENLSNPCLLKWPAHLPGNLEVLVLINVDGPILVIYVHLLK